MMGSGAMWFSNHRNSVALIHFGDSQETPFPNYPQSGSVPYYSYNQILPLA